MKNTKKTIALSDKSKGFTLIELVVVMAIIAVLALLIIAAIAAARRNAVDTQRTGDVRTLEVALESYASRNNNVYPGADGGNSGSGMVQTLYDGGYLSQIPESMVDTADPTKSSNERMLPAFRYRTDANQQKFTLVACDIRNNDADTLDLTAGSVPQTEDELGTCKPVYITTR